MQYRFTQNLGSEDARYIRQHFHFDLDHKECTIGAVVEIKEDAASYLNGKYKALLEPVESVKGVAKKPEITAPAK